MWYEALSLHWQLTSNTAQAHNTNLPPVQYSKTQHTNNTMFARAARSTARIAARSQVTVRQQARGPQQGRAQRFLRTTRQPRDEKAIDVVDRSKLDPNIALADQVPFSQLTVAEKVTETAKDGSSFAIVGVGLAAAGYIAWMFIRGMFLDESQADLYDKSQKIIADDEDVTAALGELTAGDHSHMRSAKYTSGPMEYVRGEFPVYGQRENGTAKFELKKKKDSSSKYQFRYLLVEVPDVFTGTPKQILLIDNTLEDAQDRGDM
eukprot:m.89284 g.89284  ORF g.89284 m.89284 type:complete len:263 (-) comp12888_c0_seq3:1894-2682(-)